MLNGKGLPKETIPFLRRYLHSLNEGLEYPKAKIPVGGPAKESSLTVIWMAQWFGRGGQTIQVTVGLSID